MTINTLKIMTCSKKQLHSVNSYSPLNVVNAPVGGRKGEELSVIGTCLEVQIVKVLLSLGKNFITLQLIESSSLKNDCILSKNCDRCMVQRERWMLRLYWTPSLATRLCLRVPYLKNSYPLQGNGLFTRREGLACGLTLAGGQERTWVYKQNFTSRATPQPGTT